MALRSGQRPPVVEQLREALTRAKRVDHLTFDQAWPRARDGEVCDLYRSERNDDGSPWPVPPLVPPDLEVSDGETRCVGCRYLDPNSTPGDARCALLERQVYCGVSWPHRTHERQDWKWATEAAADEWQAAFEDVETPVSRLLAMVAQEREDRDDAVA